MPPCEWSRGHIKSGLNMHQRDVGREESRCLKHVTIGATGVYGPKNPRVTGRDRLATSKMLRPNRDEVSIGSHRRPKRRTVSSIPRGLKLVNHVRDGGAVNWLNRVVHSKS